MISACASAGEGVRTRRMGRSGEVRGKLTCPALAQHFCQAAGLETRTSPLIVAPNAHPNTPQRLRLQYVLTAGHRRGRNRATKDAWSGHALSSVGIVHDSRGQRGTPQKAKAHASGSCAGRSERMCRRCVKAVEDDKEAWSAAVSPAGGSAKCPNKATERESPSLECPLPEQFHVNISQTK